MGVRININKCTGCGMCLPVCPLGVLKIKGGHNSVGPGCNNCGACKEVCVFDALIFEPDDEKHAKAKSKQDTPAPTNDKQLVDTGKKHGN